jgi:hypothetical protein
MPETGPETGREAGRAGLPARLILLLLLPLLAACGVASNAPPPDMATRSVHTHSGPAQVTLLTVVNNRTGSGDHSALLIEGTERLIFDPAGTFDIPQVTRYRDVVYGVSPAVETVYLGYHARATHDVIVQTLPLTREQADAAIAAAEARGISAPGLCAVNSSAVLRAVPGLDGLQSALRPVRLSENFGALPGVQTRTVVMDDIPPTARTAEPPPLDQRPSFAVPAG